VAAGFPTNELAPGAKRGGHPKTGVTKTKKCVSVNAAVWQSALNRWRGQMSPLVETLLSDYVKNAGNGK